MKKKISIRTIFFIISTGILSIVDFIILHVSKANTSDTVIRLIGIMILLSIFAESFCFFSDISNKNNFK